MSEKAQCRDCGTEISPDNAELNNGRCDRCASNYVRCEDCHKPFFDLKPEYPLCGTCGQKREHEANRLQHLDLYAPSTTEWTVHDSEVIQHPILGELTLESGGEWVTAELVIGPFGYQSRIRVGSEDELPAQRQLDVVVNLCTSSEAFRDEVAQRMAHEYTEVRPSYLKTIGNPSYDQNLTLADLPELEHPGDIWQAIKGFHAIYVDEEANLDLSFDVTFDPEHEFAVRINDGSFYEVMLDG